jgi:hypothetical protein
MPHRPSRLWIALAGCLAAFGGSALAEELPDRERTEAWGWTEGVPVERVVPPYMGEGLETAVLPTPKRVVDSRRLFPFDDVVIVPPDEGASPATTRDLRRLFSFVGKRGGSAPLLVAVGGPARNPTSRRLLAAMGADLAPERWEKLGDEGYLLVVGREPGGRLAAVLAGRRPAGDFWAVQTLHQLIFGDGGRRHVAAVWILDWPSFPLRGSKGAGTISPATRTTSAGAASRRISARTTAPRSPTSHPAESSTPPRRASTGSRPSSASTSSRARGPSA